MVKARARWPSGVIEFRAVQPGKPDGFGCGFAGPDNDGIAINDADHAHLPGVRGGVSGGDGKRGEKQQGGGEWVGHGVSPGVWSEAAGVMLPPCC